MITVSARSTLWLAVIGLAASCTLAGQPEPAPGELRVMSYNVRLGSAADGPNHWEHRKAFMAGTIRAFAPDLLGTQETLGFQRDYLAEQLPEYDWVGVGRDDGHEAGEMMALYYRRARFEKLDAGHFWLSETPELPGSKGWDSAYPRMVTWVRLRDRRHPAVPLVVLNTHFDHQGATARLESARLLRRRIDTLAQQGAVVLTGDFNTGEGSPPYAALFGAVAGAGSPLRDSYRTAHPATGADEGTYTGFDASATKGDRIDWIAVSRHWQVVAATIDRAARDGRTPSDHFAVTASLAISRSGDDRQPGSH